MTGQMATKINSGNVGIGTTGPNEKLTVNGNFSATSKSFVIDHPTKPGMKLVHGSLEGPEFGVYYRGEATTGNTGTVGVELPEYFEALTRKDGRTVHLTSMGLCRVGIGQKIIEGKFTVIGDRNCEFSWLVIAERGDISPLEVEQKRT